MIYLTDTDEYLKYVTDGGTNRWMQAELKPNRNTIINGGFDVWQRGTSIASSGSGITTYSADRWRFGNNGASAYTVSRVSNSATLNTVYAFRITCNNGATGSNGIEYFTEYLDTVRLRGKYLTVSFWIRGSTTFSGASGLGIDTGTNTNDSAPGVGNGQTGGVSIMSSSVNITTSWQKVVVTSSSVVAANAGMLRLTMPKPSMATSAWFEITGVQLEVGTASSEFEFREFGDELRRCQRYYCKSYPQGVYYGLRIDDAAREGGEIFITTNASSIGSIRALFPVEMRTTPAVDMSSWDVNTLGVANGGSFTAHQPSVGNRTCTMIYRSSTGIITQCTSIANAIVFFAYQAGAEL